MKQSNTESQVDVTSDDLPLHCPAPGSSMWDSHPKVYIPLAESTDSKCPYCGTVYRLVAGDKN